MHLSVDISMYPLQDGYKIKIQNFLNMLNSYAINVDIRTSNMSTRIFGEFDDVNTLLNACIKESMERYGKVVFVCKYLEGDARKLEGYD
ncbi:MAG: hypothetical protein ACI854_001151 [Arenicella sp.]|jgi:uncharacterized protein YqgV (UPF0045/DUF77 family)